MPEESSVIVFEKLSRLRDQSRRGHQKGEKSLLSPKTNSYKFDWSGSLNNLCTTREEENIQTACCLPIHLVSCELPESALLSTLPKLYRAVISYASGCTNHPVT